MDSIRKQIMQAIAASGKPPGRVAREAGLARSQLLRFSRGLDSHMSTVERIADALGFELVLKPKRRKRKG